MFSDFTHEKSVVTAVICRIELEVTKANIVSYFKKPINVYTYTYIYNAGMYQLSKGQILMLLLNCMEKLISGPVLLCFTSLSAG